MIVQRAPVYQETAEHIVMVDTLAQEVVAEHYLGYSKIIYQKPTAEWLLAFLCAAPR